MEGLAMAPARGLPMTGLAQEINLAPRMAELKKDSAPKKTGLGGIFSAVSNFFSGSKPPAPPAPQAF